MVTKFLEKFDKSKFIIIEVSIKNINVIANFCGQQKVVHGILLSYFSNIILQTQQGINSINEISQIFLLSIPEEFFVKLTLNWKVSSLISQTIKYQVAYQTSGLKGKADDNFVLNNNQTKADLGGWVTIDNHSRKTYNAKLKLVAGDVNIVQPSTSDVFDVMLFSQSFKEQSQLLSFDQKQFSDYHLDILSTLITLNYFSSKQLEFIPKVYNINVDSYNELQINSDGRAQTNLIVTIQIRFNNSNSSSLGIPIPAEIVRFFKQNLTKNTLEFIVEDSIGHTSKNENITLTIGSSFDIKADIFQMNRLDYLNGGYTTDMKLNQQLGDIIKMGHKQYPSTLKNIKQFLQNYHILNQNEKIDYKWTQLYQV